MDLGELFSVSKETYVPMKFTLVKDIKENIIILDIKCRDDSTLDKEWVQVDNAIEYVKYFDAYEDCFDGIDYEITTTPKQFLVKWNGGWNYEHTEYDSWFEIIKQLNE